MSKTVRLVTALSVLASAFAVPASAQEAPEQFVRTRLTVLGAPGASPGGMVTGGIPFPSDLGVTDVEDIGLWVDRTSRRADWDEVPVQWKVLSRWGGRPTDRDRPIRWALATFPGSPGGRYTLTSGGGMGTADMRPALATAGRDSITVNTGRISFTVPKDRFAPLSGLTVKMGGESYEPFRGQGLDVTMVNVEKTDPKGAGTATRDVTYRLSDAPADAVTLEQNGPLRAVVRMSGRFVDSAGDPLLKGFIGYTIRLVADAGSDSVRLFFTLENNGQYGPSSEPLVTMSDPKWLHIRKLELTLPTGLTGDLVGITREGAYELASGGAGPDFRLLQLHEVRVPDDESQNFRFTVQTGGRSIASGDRSNGGLALARVTERAGDGSPAIGDAVMVAMRHFWQNYPKAISLDAGKLRFELFPQEPGEKWPHDDGDLADVWGDAYQFEGGRHKTHELLLAFPGRRATSDDVAAREARLQSPPALRLDPVWVDRCGVMGALGPVDLNVRNADLSNAVRHFARMQAGQVDAQFSDPQCGGSVPPASLVTQREMRGSALKSMAYGLDSYGFMNFGDVTWAGGYSSGHYDWIRGLLTNYVRFGRREFLDVGVEMMRHRYDIDQFHGRERLDPSWSWFNGFQRSESGHHGAYSADFYDGHEQSPTPEATWLEGLLTGYALTGDERAFETARENAEAFVNYYTHGSNRLDPRVRRPLEYLGQLEGFAGATGELLAFYEFTGEKKYADAAELIFEDGILFAEELVGSEGLFEVEGEPRQLFPMLRLLQPLMRMHQVRQDDRALALLLRILNWVQTKGYAGTGVTVEGGYVPLQLPYSWVHDGTGENDENRFVPYDFLTCDAFAYAFATTGEESYLAFARRLFRDSVLFCQTAEGTPVSADFYGSVSYLFPEHLGAETRIGAWLLNGHNRYLSVEREFLRRNPGQAIDLDLDGFFTGFGEEQGGIGRQGGNDAFVGGSVTTSEGTCSAAEMRVTFVARRTPVVDPMPGPPPVYVAPVPGVEVAATRFTPPVTATVVPDMACDPAPSESVREVRVSPQVADVRVAPPVAAPTRVTRQPVETRPTILVEDTEASLAGAWSETVEETAHGGSQRVARDPEAAAAATFRVAGAASGAYRLWLYWGRESGAARSARVRVRDVDGITDVTLDQTRIAGRWRLLGEFSIEKDTTFAVTLSNENSGGAVVADAIKLEPVSAR